MRRRKNHSSLISSGIAATLFAGALWWYVVTQDRPEVRPSPLTFTSSVTEVSTLPLTKEYTNTTYRFKVAMPEAFKATEVPTEERGKTIVLQDQGGQGIQIHVTPYTGDVRTLTADDIRASIPDMQVTEEQTVEIGNEHRGVAFRSDNEAFGDSREVWFVFRGNLYQISTFARFDPLLKAMFGTWQFN